LGGLINALKVANKKIGDSKVVINGAGAAGMTIAKLIIAYGVKHLVVCDTKGAIYKGRK
jgi:malate dehydrogenase (oxaloacetate-decarboxylating)